MSGLAARDARALWHPYTQHAIEPAPLPVARARGAVLELADGREVVDAISSWWCVLHGHGEPRLVEAMARQARELDHVLFAGATHEPAVALAEELLAAAPAGAGAGGGRLTRVFFSDDGSTAVEVALKIAWLHHAHRGEARRTRFVALEGGYHGDTLGAMALGDPEPFFRPFAPLLFDVARATPDEAGIERALDEAGERACALVIEPLVQGAAGMRMHAPEVVRAARRLCDERGVVLVADEVMTGFGRTGALFACERAGVVPDLLCLSKALTGGTLPLAATLAKERLFASFLSADRGRALFHGHTYTANPIACAVARESLALCRERGVPERLDAIGRRIAAGLAGLEADERVLDVRRTGGIVAVERRPPEGERPGYLAEGALRLRAAALERGVLLRPLGDVLYALPPACTTPEQCDRIAAVMADLART